MSVKEEIRDFMSQANRRPSIFSSDREEQMLAVCLSSYGDKTAGAYDPEFIKSLEKEFPEVYKFTSEKLSDFFKKKS